MEKSDDITPDNSKITRPLSTPEKLTSASTFTFGLYSFARALFWIMESKTAVNDSPLYKALHQVYPLWIWGSLIMFFSICLIASCFYIPHRLTRTIYDLLVMIGGIGLSFFYFFLAVAGINNSINWLTPISFLILSAGLGVIGFIGGVNYFGKREG
ncbi:hypothetical protein ETI06_05920 [Macrococcoides goetzii]|nr:hypothetical protein [Macrococcus goetzii]TDM50009.1 hypothetical protein ETI06_05920 [Macrococcus goetzii]